MTLNLDEERKFLDSLVIDYKDQTPYSKAKKDIIHTLISDRIENPSSKKVLQLGCSGGYETEFLARTFGSVDVIDGSKKFIDEMTKKNKNKNLKFIYSLFEDYQFQDEEYDYIFCNYILEHVHSPVDVLSNVRKSLTKDGKIFATVPNLNAFSRKLALEMGLINDLASLTENDHRHGHRRTYTTATVVKDFQDSEFSVLETKGVVFKILADFQLNQMFEHGIITEKHIFALQTMSEIDKELCDSIFLVAKR